MTIICKKCSEEKFLIKNINGICNRCKRKEKPYYRKDYQWKKDSIFKSYGGYKCACCGETEKYFLSIDHINNDGAKHRKEIVKIRPKTYFYKWLWENNYPKGFQVLCRNCNWGKYMNLKKNKKDYCFHQNGKKETKNG